MPDTALLDRTIEFWQPRADRLLSREDARQIIANLTGFFGLLVKWDAAKREPSAPANEGGPAVREGEAA